MPNMNAAATATLAADLTANQSSPATALAGPIDLCVDATLHIGDALDLLTTLPDASFDAVVTDPPYAIKKPRKPQGNLDGAHQDGCPDTEAQDANACPGCARARAVASFADAAMLGQQSQNWHAKETHSRGYADNDPAAFQQWCELWLAECLRVLKPGGHLVAFGGTRTWHRLAVAAENTGFEIRDSLAWIYSSGMPKSHNVGRALARSEHAHLADAWTGWGTALKPAFEPVVLGRRPLAGRMVDNIAGWGVGPLRVSTIEDRAGHLDRHPEPAPGRIDSHAGAAASKWPTNVHLDDEQARRLNEQRPAKDARDYFWVSKPNRKERIVIDGVGHPTVKPLDLMQHLIRLVTPEGGTVLDPFAGSGTTVEAALNEHVRVVGIERDAAYVPLIHARVARHISRTQGPRADASHNRDLAPDHAATLF